MIYLEQNSIERGGSVKENQVFSSFKQLKHLLYDICNHIWCKNGGKYENT